MMFGALRVTGVERLWLLTTLAAVVVVLLPHLMAHDGRLLLAGDFSWPLNFPRFFELTLSTRDDSYGFSSPASRQHASLLLAAMGSVLIDAGLAPDVVQQLFFGCMVVASAIGCLELGRRLRFPISQAVIFANLFLTSSIALNYWAPDHGSNMFAYYLLPPVVALVVRFMQSGGIVALFILFALALNPSFSNPVFFIVYVGFIGLFGALVFVSDRRLFFASVGCRFSIALAVFTAPNLVWLLPFVLEIAHQFSSATNATAGLISDRETAVLDSAGLFYALIGSGGAMWTSVAEHEPLVPIRQWGHWVHWAPVVLAQTILTVSALAVGFHARRLSPLWLGLFGSYICLLLLVSGMRLGFPLNIPTVSLLDLPGFGRAFRSIFMKLGFGLAMTWALLVSYVLCEIGGRPVGRSRYILTTMVGLCLILGSVPFLTQTVNRVHPQGNYPSEYVSIPDSYMELRQTVGESGSREPMAVLPLSDSYNVDLEWEQGGGYKGAYFLRTIWSGPILLNDDNSEAFARLEGVCQDRQVGQCVDHLRDLGVGFIYVDDASRYPSPLGQLYKVMLLEMARSGDKIRKVASTGHYTIYRVLDSEPINYTLDCQGDCARLAVSNEQYGASVLLLKQEGGQDLHVGVRGNTAGFWLDCGRLTYGGSGQAPDVLSTVATRVLQGVCSPYRGYLENSKDWTLLVYRPFLAFGLGLILALTTLGFLVVGSVFCLWRYGIDKHRSGH